MKILIVHTKYLSASGGSEKICTFLADTLVSLLHDVEIATYENTLKKPSYPPRKEVRISNLYGKVDLKQNSLLKYNKYKGKNLIIWLLSKVRKSFFKLRNKIILTKYGGKKGLYKYNLEQKSKMWNTYILNNNPDLIITLYLGTALEISHIKNYNIPILNSVNGRPDFDYTDILWERSEIELEFLKNSYNNIDGSQLLLRSYKEFVPEENKSLVDVIGNPVIQVKESDIVNHLIKKDRYIISHVGTLCISHKQQEKAIEIFSQIAGLYPNWDMFFWGEGEDYKLLKSLIVKLKLENRVFLKGFTEEPIEELKKSDVFIFPSRYEGFGIALAEAMTVGVPCLGFSDCSGVNELIEHNENGFLANNDLELKDNLIKLIEDSSLRQKMGYKGHLKMKQFAPEKIVEKWRVFVNEVYNKHQQKDNTIF